MPHGLNFDGGGFRHRPIGASVSSAGLPQLNGIAFGIVQSSEAAVGITLRIKVNRNSNRAQLSHNRVEIADAKGYRPTLSSIVKIRCRLGERSKGAGSGFPPPGALVITRWRKRYPKAIAVLLAQRGGFAPPKEQTPDAITFSMLAPLSGARSGFVRWRWRPARFQKGVIEGRLRRRPGRLSRIVAAPCRRVGYSSSPAPRPTLFPSPG